MGPIRTVLLASLVLASPVHLTGQDSTQVADTLPARPSLVEAARAGDAATVLSLLDEGADPNQADASGNVALGSHLQRFQDPLLMIRALLVGGADPNRANRSGTTPLMFACQWASPELVEMLLEAGADPNGADGVGDVPLGAYIASHHDRVAIARVLLAAGADPGRPNGSGVTPRMFADHWGPPELVRLLRGSG